MRTTLDIDDDLLRDTKLLAQKSGKTLTRVVEDALRERLARRAAAAARPPLKLTTFRGSGLQPGVNLDDSAALRDLMDGLTDAPA